jgi:Polysaccharide deacetylase/Domain of unknown function (DUF3473)
MKPCFLSIDFEDFTHDFQRALGVEKPRKAPEVLWQSYEIINSFSQESLGGARLTFFTTGQVAREYPDVVQKIATDGHEIGCHFNEHDNIAHHTPESFRANLEIAIETLSSASGQVIKGFRAPDFSIQGASADWAYEELSKYFVYDSSYVIETSDGINGGLIKFDFSNSSLWEFPVYRRRVAPGFYARIVGGTYLRLLPSGAVRKYLNEASDAGFLPLVYLHPYEFMWKHEAWSKFADLKGLQGWRRLYWWGRQHQWHSIGNAGVIRKLGEIYQQFTHPGTMASWIDEKEQGIHYPQKRRMFASTGRATIACILCTMIASTERATIACML